jgi:hypothetical protein
MKFGTQMKGVKVGPRNFFRARSGFFLVASEWDSKGKTLPADCEQLERHAKLKLCRELHTIDIGPRNLASE